MKEFFKKYSLIIFLFLLAFILRLIYVLIADTPIISDFKTMYDASLELLNGTHNYLNTTYFQLWGYQTGHVFYQYLLLKIWNSITFLEIMNSFISSISVIFIYLICKKITSNKSSKIISILYALFPYSIFLNSVLTNQQLPLLLSLISIYLLIGIDYHKYIKRSIIIGILLGISNILRSEGIIFIISILVYSLFQFRTKDFKKIMISFIIILSSYLCIYKGTSYLFQKTNISKNGLNNGNTYWKFVAGLNVESDGMYTDLDASIYSADKDKAKEETIKRIKDSYKHPLLFIKKEKILWFNSDLYWPLGHISNRNLYNGLNGINQLFIITFLVLSLFSIKDIIKIHSSSFLIYMIILMYFGVYLFIEVMPRYAYTPHAFLVLLSALGLDKIIKVFKKN